MNATAYLEQRFGVQQTPEEYKDNTLRGILHTDDYESFVLRSDVGDDLLTFQGAKTANRCLPGDHVRWDEEHGRCELELQDQHPLLVGTLHLTQPARYGMTRRKVPLYLFTPYDSRYPPMVVGSSEKDKSRNVLCLVQYESWESTAFFPRGTLQQTLGRSGDLEAERRAIVHQVCPWKYPKIPFCPNPCRGGARRPLGGMTFHVDPEGCRDVDDILTIETLDDHLWRVVITISDVAAYVEEGGAVDIMASLISQSVYDRAGRVLHSMLPSEYGEGVCSLLPGSTKWGLSLEVQWDGFHLSDPVWYESECTVDRSYTYDEFQRERSSHQMVLQAVASHLAGKKGGDFLEDAHDWIEQMMLYYNKEAGKRLREAGKGILRRHAPGERERVEAYRQNLPEWSFLAYSSAEYVMADDPDTFHSGLQTDAYAHVTSPIRRYADLVNQRILKMLVAHSSSSFLPLVPVAMCDLNHRERVIRQFERDLTFLEAIEAGQTRVMACLLDREEVEGEQGPSYRVSFYVPAWKKRVSSVYRKVAEDVIATKDESETRMLRLYETVEVQCAVQWSMRNWKDRLMIQWL